MSLLTPKNPIATLGRSYTEQKNHFAIGRNSERCSYHTDLWIFVSVEFLTICRIPGSPKSEQNRKSCGKPRFWRERDADRQKSHSNLKKSSGMKLLARVDSVSCLRETDRRLFANNSREQLTLATTGLNVLTWKWMKLTMEISSIENSNLHIQIKKLKKL